MISRLRTTTVAALLFCLAASPPTTKPTLPELEVHAVALMRNDQWADARALFEEIGRATPPAQRSRPLVLNRAIVDVATKANAMRAVRELSDYLRANRDPDETATNILGSALNIT